MPGSGAIIREILKLYPKDVIEVASYGIQYFRNQDLPDIIPVDSVDFDELNEGYDGSIKFFL